MDGFLPKPVSSLSSAAGDEGWVEEPARMMELLDGLRLDQCDGRQLIDARLAALKLVAHVEAFAVRVDAELLAAPTERFPDRADGDGDAVAPMVPTKSNGPQAVQPAKPTANPYAANTTTTSTNAAGNACSSQEQGTSASGPPPTATRIARNRRRWSTRLRRFDSARPCHL